MNARSIVYLVGLAACAPDEDDGAGGSSAHQRWEEDEVCDGLDNDGDGAVDESFPDSDGDTVRDCVDPACDPEVTAATVSPVELPCVPTYTFEVSHGIDSLHPPSTGTRVAPLVDHDLDGVLTALDTPSIVIPTEERLAVHDAATGALDWTVAGSFNSGAGAIADVDGDSAREVLVVRYPYPEVEPPVYDDVVVEAYDAAGELEWSSDVLHIEPVDADSLTVADLDGDGSVEVIGGRWVLDGATGAHLFDLVGDLDRVGTLVVADVDLDGTAEIIAAHQVFDHTGALEWEAVPAAQAAYAAPVQLDYDAQAELIFVLPHGELKAFEPDGTEIIGFAASDPSAVGAGVPCVADFDGDGMSEVAVPSLNHLTLFDTDGTTLWSSNRSGFAQVACTAFDFDQDGVPEILSNDLSMGGAPGLRIQDAATGLLLAGLDTRTTGSVLPPTIVDVDLDGSADLLVVADRPVGYGNQILVVEHVLAGWPAVGSSWAVEDFAVGRVSEEGVVGLPVDWLAGFNAQVASGPMSDLMAQGGVELRVDVLDTCAASCVEGPQEIVVQVSNRGELPSPAGLPLELVGHRDDGEVVLRSEVLAAIPGLDHRIVTFTLDPEEVPDALEVRIVSDHERCSPESEEALQFSDGDCPDVGDVAPPGSP